MSGIERPIYTGTAGINDTQNFQLPKIDSFVELFPEGDKKFAEFIQIPGMSQALTMLVSAPEDVYQRIIDAIRSVREFPTQRT